jgi:predicted TIM-barrel fold metal-dependent hydrolase
MTTSGMNSHDNLRFAIDLLGSERIMFAIDFPYESSAQSVQFLETAPIGERDRENIAHRNAERVFRIKVRNYNARSVQ